MIERKYPLNYCILKNYNELTEEEKLQAYDEINVLYGNYTLMNELPEMDDPDVIIEEAKKHLFIIDGMDVLLGNVAVYSDTTLDGYDNTVLLGYEQKINKKV